MNRKIFLFGFIAICLAINTDVRAEAWNIDSAQFERNWPDSLIGQFLNAETVLPLPWGGTAFGVRGLFSEPGIGVWIQNADGEWTHSSVPVPTGVSKSVDALALVKDEDSSTLILAGTWNGPYASSDSGRTWYPRNGFTMQQLDAGEGTWWSKIEDILDEGRGKWWAISPFDGPVFSPDYGESWELINTGLNHRQEFVFNTGLIYQDYQEKIWLQGEDGMYILDRHNDNRDANSWEWIPVVDGIEYDLVDGRRNCRPVLAIWPDGRCSDENGTMYLWSGWGYIFRSEDYGETWEQMTTRDDEWPAIHNGNVVPVMRVNESGLVFIGAESGGLFVSADGADNWLPIGGSSEVREDSWEHYVWWHGDNQRPVDYGLRVGGIFDLAFDSEGFLLVSTWDGVLKSSVPMNGPLEDPNLVIHTPVLPETVNLLSAYPNPFNGMLRIRTDVGQNPFVLEIFNVQGRKVAAFAGNNPSQIVWEAENLPTGQYFIRLHSQIAERTISVQLAK